MILIYAIIHALIAGIILIVPHKIPSIPAIAVPGEVLVGSLILSCPTVIMDHIPGVTAEILIVSSIVAFVTAIILVMPMKNQMVMAVAIAMKILIMRQPTLWMKMELLRRAGNSGSGLTSRDMSGRSEGGRKPAEQRQ